ncbi:MAG: hypothetical protein ACI92Z_002609 [Paracoccaceae bacterium]|jgi:hypothetical protein
MTVGSGISPDLLTIGILENPNALADLQIRSAYRRWGISPRPENKASLVKWRANLQEQL